MKRTFFAISILLLLAFPADSQIPNFSFENWISMGTYEVPDQWGTLNNTTAPSGVFTVTRGMPGNPGASYMEITSRTVGANVVPGIAVSGVLDSITLQPKSGFAFAQRPQSFNGNWQYMSFSGSIGSIRVSLTRWDSLNGQREIVASAFQSLPGMVMSWSFFSMNLSYQTGNLPDTCIIVLEASGTSPGDNDYLWVDNLGFSGNVIGIADVSSLINTVAINPNPASGITAISISVPRSSEASIELYDGVGKKVADVFSGLLIDGENIIWLDTRMLGNGVYFIKVITRDGIGFSKFFVSQ